MAYVTSGKWLLKVKFFSHYLCWTYTGEMCPWLLSFFFSLKQSKMKKRNNTCKAAAKQSKPRETPTDKRKKIIPTGQNLSPRKGEICYYSRYDYKTYRSNIKKILTVCYKGKGVAGRRHRHASDQCVNENNYEQLELLLIRGLRVCVFVARLAAPRLRWSH